MKTLREAAQQALDALHLWLWTKQIIGLEAAHDALRDALDDDALREAQVEPVAWMHTNAVGHQYFRKKPHDPVFNPQAVYLQPPRREWLGLTHEERDEICKDFVGDDGRVGAYLSLALEVEVRLTEKNRE